MDRELDMLQFTGPNMSGKSTYMRQLACMFIMAQAGSLFPAVTADCPILYQIFTRMCAAEVLANGERLFMVEM